MSKKVLMGITAVLVVLLMFTVVAPVFAIDPHEISINTSGDAADTVKDASGSIIGIVQVVGTAIAVIMLVVLGIKYVVAAPSEKADIKKSAVIYVVAAIFLFAAVNILAIIRNFSQDIFK